jgi:hypothetical protein
MAEQRSEHEQVHEAMLALLRTRERLSELVGVVRHRLFLRREPSQGADEIRQNLPRLIEALERVRREFLC